MARQKINETEFDLRPMGSEDGPAVLEFARSLPAHDLLFLRRDLTSQDEIDKWLVALEAGRVFTLLALSVAGAAANSVDGTTDGKTAKVLGYATLDRSGQPWTRHVGEVRVLVGQEARGAGLGRFLTEQIFRAALEQGVEKLVARMTLDQQGAVAVFENLGFRPEGLLKEHVVDREGNKHDLLVMAHSVAQFQATRDGFGVTEAFND